MKTQKYLASANTSLGFKNCFDSINTNKNSFTYILKGGPGTGKSTIMKKVGKHFEDKGYFVEYFYCSSDADSLDGVRVKNISIVDGTAPHTTEASVPNIKEKIVNVGAYIGNGVRKNKLTIVNLLEKKSNCFKLAYEYFETIGKLLKAEERECQINTKKNKQNFSDVTSRVALYTKNKDVLSKKIASVRTLFSSYISPDGLKSFYKDNKYQNIIKLRGNFIENQNTFNELILKLKANNFSYIKFLSVFNPNKLEAIYIENNKTLVVCEDVFDGKFVCKNQVIINKLIKKVAKLLYLAKFYHKKVESYYIKSMNFDGLTKETSTLITEIEKSLQ